MAEYIHHRNLNIPNILPSKLKNVITLLQLSGMHQKDQLYLLKKVQCSKNVRFETLLTLILQMQSKRNQSDLNILQFSRTSKPTKYQIRLCS